MHTIRQGNLDLYSEEQAEKFIHGASEKLETGGKQISYAIAELITLLEITAMREIETQRQSGKAQSKPSSESGNYKSCYRANTCTKLNDGRPN